MHYLALRGRKVFDAVHKAIVSDQSCPDSYNGAPQQLPTSSSHSQPDRLMSATVNSNVARGQFTAARQQKQRMTVGKTTDGEQDR